MKILLALVGLLAAVAAGAVGAALFAPAPGAPTGGAAVEPGRPAATAQGVPAAVESRLESLTLEVADLEAQIRELKSAAARTAVVDAAPKTEVAAAPAVTVPAAQRAQILQVLAETKAEEERAREEQRLKREEEQRLQRADRMAQRFGLNEAEERQLADFYAVSQAKLDEAREAMRIARDTGAFDAEQMRTSMRDMRDWAGNELQRLFGPEVGKQIAEAEMDRFRGGGGPGGGMGGGFGGGPDGGGQGNRPARRGGNNAAGGGGTPGG